MFQRCGTGRTHGIHPHPFPTFPAGAADGARFVLAPPSIHGSSGPAFSDAKKAKNGGASPSETFPPEGIFIP